MRIREVTKDVFESEGILDWAFWQLFYMEMKDRGLLRSDVVVQLTITEHRRAIPEGNETRAARGPSESS